MAPARAQAPYAGKGGDGLLGSVKRRMGAREGDVLSGQAYTRFRDQKTREFAARVGPAAAVWKAEKAQRTKLGRSMISIHCCLGPMLTAGVGGASIKFAIARGGIWYTAATELESWACKGTPIASKHEIATAAVATHMLPVARAGFFMSWFLPIHMAR